MGVEDAHWLRQQAQKLRALARSTLDQRVAQALREMATEYDERAETMENSE